MFDKIAQGLKIDANNPNNKEVFKNTTVVVPEPDSKLIQVIKRSDKIKNLIKSEYENIVNGKYKNQYFAKQNDYIALTLKFSQNKVLWDEEQLIKGLGIEVKRDD